MVPHVTQKWEELGIKLLKDHQVAQLNTIKLNNPSDNRKCCLDMFKHWLQTNTDANWKQLIAELRSPGVDLPVVAEDLEKKVLGTFVLCTHVHKGSSIFSAFLQEYRKYARGGDKSSCMLSKMLVLATVPSYI